MAAFLLDQSRQTEAPVDIEAVVGLWKGVRISYCKLDGDGYIVDLQNHGAEILLNDNAHPSRQRFTLAHELGHLVLFRAGIDEGKGRSLPKVERWCNRFASMILVPKQMLREYLKVVDRSSLTSLLILGPSHFKCSKAAFFQQVTSEWPMTIQEIKVANGIPEEEVRFSKSRRWSERSEFALRKAQQVVTRSDPSTSMIRVHGCSMADMCATAQRISRGAHGDRWLIVVTPEALAFRSGS